MLVRGTSSAINGTPSDCLAQAAPYSHLTLQENIGLFIFFLDVLFLGVSPSMIKLGQASSQNTLCPQPSRP